MKKLLAVCVSLGTHIAPLMAETSQHANETLLPTQVAGKTIRFDESDLRFRGARGSEFRRHQFIAYFDPNGLAYIWFPSQQFIQVAEWDVHSVTGMVTSNAQPIETREVTSELLCYTSSPPMRNRCRSQNDFDQSVQEVLEQDVFNLQTQILPCRLCRADTEFATILKTTGQ